MPLALAVIFIFAPEHFFGARGRVSEPLPQSRKTVIATLLASPRLPHPVFIPRSHTSKYTRPLSWHGRPFLFFYSLFSPQEPRSDLVPERKCEKGEQCCLTSPVTYAGSCPAKVLETMFINTSSHFPRKTGQCIITRPLSSKQYFCGRCKGKGFGFGFPDTEKSPIVQEKSLRSRKRAMHNTKNRANFSLQSISCQDSKDISGNKKKKSNVY